MVEAQRHVLRLWYPNINEPAYVYKGRSSTDYEQVEFKNATIFHSLRNSNPILANIKLLGEFKSATIEIVPVEIILYE